MKQSIRLSAIFLSFFLTASLFSLTSEAADNASTMVAPKAEASSTSAEVSKIEAAPKQDIDAEVKDIKMRADSGKKAQLSSSFYLNYSGGSLHKPSEDVRPNVAGDRRIQPVKLSGDVGVRYRKNKNESFFIATGVSRVRPFHSKKDDEKWEMSTPHLAYNKTHAVGATQVSSSFRAYIMTEDFFRDIGQLGTLGYSLIAKRGVGTSRFTGGISMNIYHAFFDKDEDSTFEMKQGPMTMQMPAGRFQNDYGISFSPAIQFAPNDRSYFYTSWSLLSYSHYRSKNMNDKKWDHGNITQSLGLGYAVARDFYISPYVTFVTDDLSREKTSVNLSTTINL